MICVNRFEMHEPVHLSARRNFRKIAGGGGVPRSVSVKLKHTALAPCKRHRVHSTQLSSVIQNCAERKRYSSAFTTQCQTTSLATSPHRNSPSPTKLQNSPKYYPLSTTPAYTCCSSLQVGLLHENCACAPQSSFQASMRAQPLMTALRTKGC